MFSINTIVILVSVLVIVVDTLIYLRHQDTWSTSTRKWITFIVESTCATSVVVLISAVCGLIG